MNFMIICPYTAGSPQLVQSINAALVTPCKHGKGLLQRCHWWTPGWQHLHWLA